MDKNDNKNNMFPLNELFKDSFKADTDFFIISNIDTAKHRTKRFYCLKILKESIELTDSAPTTKTSFNLDCRTGELLINKTSKDASFHREFIAKFTRVLKDFENNKATLLEKKISSKKKEVVDIEKNKSIETGLENVQRNFIEQHITTLSPEELKELTGGVAVQFIMAQQQQIGQLHGKMPPKPSSETMQPLRVGALLIDNKMVPLEHAKDLVSPENRSQISKNLFEGLQTAFKAIDLSTNSLKHEIRGDQAQRRTLWGHGWKTSVGSTISSPEALLGTMTKSFNDLFAAMKTGDVQAKNEFFENLNNLDKLAVNNPDLAEGIAALKSDPKIQEMLSEIIASTGGMEAIEPGTDPAITADLIRALQHSDTDASAEIRAKTFDLIRSGELSLDPSLSSQLGESDRSSFMSGGKDDVLSRMHESVRLDLAELTGDRSAMQSAARTHDLSSLIDDISDSFSTTTFQRTLTMPPLLQGINLCLETQSPALNFMVLSQSALPKPTRPKPPLRKAPVVQQYPPLASTPKTGVTASLQKKINSAFKTASKLIHDGLESKTNQSGKGVQRDALAKLNSLIEGAEKTLVRLDASSKATDRAALSELIEQLQAAKQSFLSDTISEVPSSPQEMTSYIQSFQHTTRASVQVRTPIVQPITNALIQLQQVLETNNGISITDTSIQSEIDQLKNVAQSCKNFIAKYSDGSSKKIDFIVKLQQRVLQKIEDKTQLLQMSPGERVQDQLSQASSPEAKEAIVQTVFSNIGTTFSFEQFDDDQLTQMLEQSSRPIALLSSGINKESAAAPGTKIRIKDFFLKSFVKDLQKQYPARTFTPDNLKMHFFEIFGDFDDACNRLNLIPQDFTLSKLVENCSDPEYKEMLTSFSSLDQKLETFLIFDQGATSISDLKMNAEMSFPPGLDNADVFTHLEREIPRQIAELLSPETLEIPDDQSELQALIKTINDEKDLLEPSNPDVKTKRLVADKLSLLEHIRTEKGLRNLQLFIDKKAGKSDIVLFAKAVKDIPQANSAQLEKLTDFAFSQIYPRLTTVLREKGPEALKATIENYQNTLLSEGVPSEICESLSEKMTELITDKRQSKACHINYLTHIRFLKQQTRDFSQPSVDFHRDACKARVIKDGSPIYDAKQTDFEDSCAFAKGLMDNLFTMFGSSTELRSHWATATRELSGSNIASIFKEFSNTHLTGTPLGKAIQITNQYMPRTILDNFFAEFAEKANFMAEAVSDHPDNFLSYSFEGSKVTVNYSYPLILRDLTNPTRIGGELTFDISFTFDSSEDALPELSYNVKNTSFSPDNPAGVNDSLRSIISDIGSEDM
jgi:hypothetical protein